MITIITPTYNRAYILKNAYESLKKQTDRRFVWLIIDDGSNDNTEELINTWKTENKISIEYIKKENGGKASALNVAIDNIRTEYAVCLDSDDIFYDNTIEVVLKQLEKEKNNDKCCGVLALRNNPDGTVMGSRRIPNAINYVSAQDIFLRFRLRTELICFYKTSILKQYKFPEFVNEKFVSPAWMQYSVTHKYKFRVSQDQLCQCEYVEDGLTKNKRKVIAKNPKGYTCVKCFSFNLAPTLKLKIKHGIMYDCGCIIAHDKKWLRNVKNKGLAILLRPIAYGVYICRFRKIVK